jgi:hypothetical protein
VATGKLYIKWLLSLANKETDIDSNTLKVMLCTSSYTPSQSAHQYKSSITNEITGTGYTAGGAALGSVTVGTSSLVFTVDAADTVWTSSTLVARYAVIYDSTPASDATRPLVAYQDVGSDISTTNASFTVTWDGTGIAQITAA